MTDDVQTRLLHQLEALYERVLETAGEVSALANRGGWESRESVANKNSASITVSKADGIGFVVGLIGVFAIVIAVASVLIVSAWRSADMDRLADAQKKVAELTAQVSTHDAYIQAAYARLNKLESH